jgi:subtilisin family serine protease
LKRELIRLILVLALLGSATARAGLGTNTLQGTNSALSANAPVVPSYIVTLKREADQDGCARDFAITRHHIYRHVLNGFSANLDAATVEKLRHDLRVQEVERDGRVVPCKQTPSSGFIRMGVANFPEAHINGLDNRINVDVAVLDTGIQTNHPDLNVVQWVDVTGSGQGGEDNDGHGTHVAGIIGALDNNIGVVGVAPGVRLWSVQVFAPGSDGAAWSDVIAGCEYIATNTQIAVVNCSLGSDGSPTPYDAIHQAVTNLVNLEIVFVAAVGNFRADIAYGGGYGSINNIVPAAFPEVMAVSAMDPVENVIAYFTDYSTLFHVPAFVNAPGAGIDLTEPGVNILSTYTNSGYATLSGTSMSCGFASGLVALYIAANGRATNAQGVYAIRQALINSGQPQSDWPTDINGGYTYDPDGFFEPLGIPSESWVPAPNITSASMTAQGFQISFPTVPGYTYTVQSTGSLNMSNTWSNLTSTNGTGSLATVTVTDTNQNAISFYHVLQLPAP